jgi:RNA polymerase sigma factor (TIGR02999 family)
MASGNKVASISQLLLQWNEGDQAAIDQLMPVVYDELRRLARSYLRRERPDHTLQPTALVNEAYLRLIDQHSVTWRNRAHFFGIAAQMMRRILVNHALAKQAAKRGGFAHMLTLEDAEAEGLAPPDRRGIDVVALDEALKELERLDPRQTQIVELRYFGGLSIDETAEVLHISPATIKREWTTARLWLRRRIARP